MNKNTIIAGFITKNFRLLILILISSLSVNAAHAQGRRARKLPPPGQPAQIQLTPYKTTMLGDGKDTALISVKIVDRDGKEVADAQKTITFHIKGDAKIINIRNAGAQSGPDTALRVPVTGNCWLVLQAGPTRGVIKLAATADTLWAATTEIHTVQPGTPHPVTGASYTPHKVKDKILGADISSLPESEARGMKFSDNGIPGDPIKIMKAHGFNYIRLRIFNEPGNPKGYAYKKSEAFCDLAHTMVMAKRIKAAGMKFLLDFHYSDYWADPQQQNKPLAWVGEDFPALKKSLYDWTVKVMTALKDQGTTPDMVQVGNEINHGMDWPDGEIGNLDSLAQLIYSGVQGVRAVSRSTIIMLHIALGGQNAEARFFVDNMLARKVPFDVIGLSYYPQWHGTPEDLKNNMTDLATRYKQQVMVAEYSPLKKEVNDIAFTAPGKKAIGTFIWEPINGGWESIFDRDGKTNQYMNIYPEIAKEYVK
jgi:arabinogalactan endo-1,4-beta-galactosidase